MFLYGEGSVQIKLKLVNVNISVGFLAGRAGRVVGQHREHLRIIWITRRILVAHCFYNIRQIIMLPTN